MCSVREVLSVTNSDDHKRAHVASTCKSPEREPCPNLNGMTVVKKEGVGNIVHKVPY